MAYDLDDGGDIGPWRPAVAPPSLTAEEKAKALAILKAWPGFVESPLCDEDRDALAKKLLSRHFGKNPTHSKSGK